MNAERFYDRVTSLIDEELVDLNSDLSTELELTPADIGRLSQRLVAVFGEALADHIVRMSTATSAARLRAE